MPTAPRWPQRHVQLGLTDINAHPLPLFIRPHNAPPVGAIALLWSLARAFGRRLPVAIDTPLGRLDLYLLVLFCMRLPRHVGA
ncbi:MAG: hypothetical protein HC910_00010 [Spirulinaceae cyanobacterium SM2_1_0]|nr:hypothetical protein [Spirulinaceae cyanobacterium SM2_1_0]